MNRFQERITAVSARGPFVAGAIMGSLAGPPFGLFMGLTGHSVGEGIFEAVFFGVFFGLSMGFVMRRITRRAFQNGETTTQRMEVTCAVAKGQAINDPALAGAVISMADDVLRQNSGHMGTFGRWFSPVGLCISIVFLIGAILRNDTTVVVVWIVLTAIYALNLWLIPRRQKRQVANARKARDHAQSLAVVEPVGSPKN